MRTLAGSIALSAALVASAAPLGSQGSLVFHRHDTASIGAPRSIVSADFNRDGFPDVAIGGTARASIGILFHHGLEEGDEGQRFKPLQEIAVGGGPFELAAGDLNRDGLADIAVANADRDAVTVLLNDPRHEFRSVLHVPVAENPRGLAIADFNRDAVPDIIVTKYMGSTLEVLFGAGDGTFPARRSYPAPSSAQGVAAADLNHDGWMDAVVVSAGGTVSVYTMSAAGATRRDERRSHGWNVVTTGDFDRNGHVDVAYASTASSLVEVMYRHANGAWTWNGDPLPVAASPRGIETADMNQDGFLDLVVAGRSASTVTLLLRNPDGVHSSELYSRHDVAAGTGARDVTLTDFNLDGRTDILTADEFGDSTTLLGNGSDFGPAPAFRFEVLPIPSLYDNSTFGVADFNHNGRPDLARLNQVLFDAAAPSRHLGPDPGHSASGGAVADFNNDGHPDVAYTESDHLKVYLGDGAGNFADGPPVFVGRAGLDMRTADMNRDGRFDLVLTSRTQSVAEPGFLDIWLGRGDGHFDRSSRVTASFRALEVGDVDRDGVTDAVLSVGDGLMMALGDGRGGWKSVSTYGNGTPRYGLALGDVTSDGILDVVVANGKVYSWGDGLGPKFSVLRGAGNGTFEEIAEYDTSEPGVVSVISGVMLADLDHDGSLDVFTTGGHFMRGGGEFGPPQRFAPETFRPRLAADVNGDGLLDVLGYEQYRAEPGQFVMLNTRTPPSANRPPTGLIIRDRVELRYRWHFEQEDAAEIMAGPVTDADLHAIRYVWTVGGRVVGRYEGWVPGPEMGPGEYEVTVTADDYRGASISRTFTLVVTPHKENVIHPVNDSILHGAWQIVNDPEAAEGRRLWHPNANAPKLQAPLAVPTNYVDVSFLADPTQEYKLWIRMKADADHWANDSVFVQFTGAEDALGNPVYELGTTSALAVNLEECSGCGLSGWGWEDDGWGAPNRNGVTLRFPAGGRQRIRIQTREDGISIDQIVLSAEKYKTARPGSAKNDSTLLLPTGPFLGTWWF